MNTSTTWLNDVTLPETYKTLNEDITTDVVIVGGGLAGTFSAYLLAKAGKNVVLVDKGTIEGSTTAYTTAFLTGLIDTDLSDLVNMYGEDGTKLIWQSHQEAIDLIEQITKDEHIDCEFMRTSQFDYSLTDKELEDLEEEFDIAKKLEFKDVQLHKNNIHSFKTTGSLETPHQAKFHPLKFLIALRSAATKTGVLFFENTEAKSIEQKDAIVEVTTEKGIISASYGIITTYQPFNKPLELFAHKGMYISYVFEVEIPKGTINEGLYLDLKNPYHYMRIDAKDSHDRMIIGGEDHRSEIPLDKGRSYTALEEYLQTLIPGIEYKIVTRWDGGILEPIEAVPYIGAYSKEKPRLLVATAFSGNGMTYSAISAMILRDIVTNTPNPYLEIYDAGRPAQIKNVAKKAIDYAEEFVGGALKNAFKKKDNDE